MQNLPKITVPEFNIELPLSKLKIRARTFLVKEEKILLTAIENFDEKSPKDIEHLIDSVFQILQNCVLSQKVDVKMLPNLDVEYLFLQIRKNSISDVIELVKAHKCGHPNSINVSLTDTKVVFPEGHTNKVDLGNNIGLIMKYPSLHDSFDMKLRASTDTEAFYDIIISCIDKVYEKDDFAPASKFKKEELKAWLDNFKTENFRDINHFFSTMPYLESKTKYKCEKCGEDDELEVKGTIGFFT